MSNKINTRMVVPQSSPKEATAEAPATQQSVSTGNQVAQQVAAERAKDGFEGTKAGPTPDNDGFVIPNKDGKVAGSGTPATTGNVDLKYYGGGVLDKPVVTNMYIGDYFKSAAGQKDVKHNDAFMKDYVQNKDTESIWHQYGVDHGTAQASHLLGGKFKNGSVITQKQIENMLAKAVASGSLKPGKQSIYNFVLPPGAVLKMDDGTTSTQGLGGFHSSIKTKQGEVFYSAIAYSKGNNGIDFTNGNAEDNVTITESHEISEAVTDPHVQDAINDNNNAELGWMDMNNGEVGDIEVNDAAPGTPLSTMYGKSDGYAVQKIWSQKDGTNEIRAKNPGPVQPLPKPAKADTNNS